MTYKEVGSFNLWQYLSLEIQSTARIIPPDSSDLDKITSFLLIPHSLEKALLFGFLRKTDTIFWDEGQKADIAKAIIISLTVIFLSGLDASRIYHNIRGQSAVKLYVMFNVLEIGDKLCSSLGQDILDILFSPSTLSEPNNKPSSRRRLQFALFLFFSVVYNTVHACALFCQMITLNVAVNSYSNALLTLLLSNQFGEIKSTVFKRFERENLFQMTCADVSERFQLWIMLILIGGRNIVELATSNSSGILPSSWKGWNRFIGALCGPAFVVLGSEHSYIAKFNKLKPKVYSRFLDVFCRDYLKHSFSGGRQQENLTRRIGVPLFPLTFSLIFASSESFFSTHSLGNSTPTRFSSSVHSPSPSAKSVGFLLSIYHQFITTETNESDSYSHEYYFPSSTMSLEKACFYGLLVACVFCLLILLRMSLAVLLFRYSASRITVTTTTGEEFKDEVVRGRRKGGVWGLIDIDDSLRAEINRPLDDNDHDESLELKEVKERKRVDLMSVDRFQMVAKRIW
ncbi:eukaryotic membrane protein family-domain-containing protein [Dipodascopsis tothii]|uniref:eukaryotic membrane protein family-domain-containing protein n=1 Tax=Dipodascopsis tothii TaxID=44089 RepID=UPI0034CDB0FA